MLKLFRFLGLLSKGLAMQFTHVFGYLGLAVSLAAGYCRLPSWSAPVIGVILAVIANFFTDEADVKAMLAAVPASDGSGITLDKGIGGFLVGIYLVISIVGYLIGGWARARLDKLRAKNAAAPAALADMDEASAAPPAKAVAKSGGKGGRGRKK